MGSVSRSYGDMALKPTGAVGKHVTDAILGTWRVAWMATRPGGKTTTFAFLVPVSG